MPISQVTDRRLLRGAAEQEPTAQAARQERQTPPTADESYRQLREIVVEKMFTELSTNRQRRKDLVRNLDNPNTSRQHAIWDGELRDLRRWRWQTFEKDGRIRWEVFIEEMNRARWHLQEAEWF